MRSSAPNSSGLTVDKPLNISVPRLHVCKMGVITSLLQGVPGVALEPDADRALD